MIDNTICAYCANTDWRDSDGHGRMEMRGCSIWVNRHRFGRVKHPDECIDYYSEAEGCRRLPKEDAA